MHHAIILRLHLGRCDRLGARFFVRLISRRRRREECIFPFDNGGGSGHRLGLRQNLLAGSNPTAEMAIKCSVTEIATLRHIALGGCRLLPSRISKIVALMVCGFDPSFDRIKATRQRGSNYSALQRRSHGRGSYLEFQLPAGFRGRLRHGRHKAIWSDASCGRRSTPKQTALV